MTSALRPRSSAVAVVVVLALSCYSCRGESAETEQDRLQREFSQSMTNVVLEGWFTVDRPGEDPAPRPERYEISEVSHVAGDLWTFHARVTYGDHDFTAPIPVRLVWADDTPMVSLTDLTIPGVGSFTARVVFYSDRYVGMWRHGEVGGAQFGRIVRTVAGE